MAQHQDIGWELYRSFLAVLNEGSLSGAARTLGVAQPTVGRHVAALEKSLNLALFTRSQIGLMPTEAALSLRIYAESMRSTVAALERAAASQGTGVRGTVRVTASGLNSRIPPALPALLAGGATENPIDSHAIQPHYTGLLARACGLAVTMAAEGDKIVVAAA